MINFDTKYNIIRRKNRKNGILFKIEEGVLNIYAPLKINENIIEELYQKNIHRFMGRIKNRGNNSKDITLFGKKIPIVTERSTLLVKPHFEIKNRKFFEYPPENFSQQNVQEYLKIWKIKMIRKIIYHKINYFCERFKFSFNAEKNQIKVKNQQTRWGSCSFDNNLNFNYKIIEKSNELIDYLVLHELTHTIVKDHSDLFWKELEKFCPNCLEKKKKLNDCHLDY